MYSVHKVGTYKLTMHVKPQVFDRVSHSSHCSVLGPIWSQLRPNPSSIESIWLLRKTPMMPQSQNEAGGGAMIPPRGTSSHAPVHAKATYVPSLLTPLFKIQTNLCIRSKNTQITQLNLTSLSVCVCTDKMFKISCFSIRPFLLFCLWCAILTTISSAVHADEAFGEEEGFWASVPVVKREQRRTLVSTEYGEISAARVSDNINGSYLLHCFTLEPNSLFLPVILHADMVFYVYTGGDLLNLAYCDTSFQLETFINYQRRVRECTYDASFPWIANNLIWWCFKHFLVNFLNGATRRISFRVSGGLYFYSASILFELPVIRKGVWRFYWSMANCFVIKE